MHANRAKAKPAQAYSQQESSWKLWATVGFGVLLGASRFAVGELREIRVRNEF